jgi:hypothetical protein
MLSKILGFGPSNFEMFISNLVRNNASGGPTADEARRDYRAAILAGTVLPRS